MRSAIFESKGPFARNSSVAFGVHTRWTTVATPIPKTGAHGDNAVFNVSPMHFIDQRADQNRSGRPNRVAHRNCAASNVDSFERHFRLVHEVQNDRGKCFVDLEKIDIGCDQAGPIERFAGGGSRGRQHDAGIVRGAGGRQNFRFGLQSELFRDSSVPHQHDDCAVRNPGRIAGVMNVTNLGDLRISQPDVIAIIIPDPLKSGR